MEKKKKKKSTLSKGKRRKKSIKRKIKYYGGVYKILFRNLFFCFGFGVVGFFCNISSTKLSKNTEVKRYVSGKK